MAETEPFGQITFGGKFSRELQSGYVDILSGLYHNPDNALFLNLRGTFDDSDQQILSAGLGFRHLFEDPGVIIGANVYYDYVDSQNSNGFNQLGLGAEVLTHWVDARFNYYLPESDKHLVRTFTTTDHSRAVSQSFTNGTRIQEIVRDTDATHKFGIFEDALEGWNAEAGFLVPGLDKYLELRLFGGAYCYEFPRGGHKSGFKARAEARVTEGVTLGLEYWEDPELMGGNWVGEVAVSVPFDIGNLFTGKNPFEGAGEMFHRPKTGDLHARMDEMVIRSHRIQTNTTNPQPLGTTTTTTETTITTGHKHMPSLTPTPTGGNGEGESPVEGPVGEGQGEGPPT